MRTKKRLSRDFTQGSIYKHMFFFMLPFMASNALQVFYSTIDMIVVGEYVKTPGLSAVSLSSQVLNFATMVSLGFSSAGQVLISQALGAGKRKEINQIIGTLFGLLMILAVILTAVIVGGCQLIVKLMNVPQESKDYAIDYLVICGGGLVFTAGYNMVSAVLRGMGDSKRPLLFIAIASVTNLVLDLLFTGLLGWKVAGAAWATIIGQAASFAFSVFYLYRKREEFGFDFKKESFLLNRHYSGMILRLGTPMAIQAGSINLSMLTVNSMVNSIGVEASATFGAGIRIDDIINKISMGMQYAAVPMVSQNIAARQPERAKKTVYCTWLYAGIFTVFAIAAYLCFGDVMFRLFSDDPGVHALSKDFIYGIIWMFPALAVMRGSSAFIQGIGNAKLSMVLAIMDGVILRIGLSWFFGSFMNWGFYGFVLGYGLAPYGFAIPGLIYFLSGIWKKRKILAEEI